MWHLLFDFDIAHHAMVDDFVGVFDHRVGYLPDAYPAFASRTQHSRLFFWHDTQTRHCKSGS
jgi:hypothetical protein